MYMYMHILCGCNRNHHSDTFSVMKLTIALYTCTCTCTLYMHTCFFCICTCTCTILCMNKHYRLPPWLHNFCSSVDISRAAFLPEGITNELVFCYTTLNCDSNDPGRFTTSTINCCHLAQGVAYIPGGERCDACICK